MIQNPIIYKREETVEPLYGKVVVSADTQTIEIPVSRLCTKCVLFPVSINRTITELDTNYEEGTNFQVSAINLPIEYITGFYYDGTLLKKSSTKVMISTMSGSNKIGVSHFDFTENKITISYGSDAEVSCFSKGTYIYVAW